MWVCLFRSLCWVGSKGKPQFWGIPWKKDTHVKQLKEAFQIYLGPSMFVLIEIHARRTLHLPQMGGTRVPTS